MKVGIVLRVLSFICAIVSLFMLPPLLLALLDGTGDAAAFAVSLGTGILLSLGLFLAGRRWRPGPLGDNLGIREAVGVVGFAWVIASAVGALPYWQFGAAPRYVDAFFETMSGFTTTGATIIDDVDKLTHGLLFWRSMTQWIGGLGIVFFTTAILPSFVGGSVKVFAAEATGPVSTRLHPRLSTGAKWIWMVYLVLTVGCTLSFMVCGMGWFDSINYAMGSTATGGFSTHTDSAEFFRSPAIEYIATFFCFLSGVNFTLLYTTATHRSLKLMYKSEEFRFYTFVVIAFSLFIIAQLMLHNGYDLEKAFRCGIFQVVSFITTTGLFNDDAAQWPHVTWVVLATCMFLGACSGSTSGGFKSIRSVMMLKIIRNEFKQILHPNAILPIHVDGSNIPSQKRVTLLSFLAVYLLLCLFASFIFIAAGVDNTNAITITLSTLGNVGPSLGLEIGPTMSWSMLPAGIKWVCSALMLIGRIEIFTILVIFTPAFWKDR